MTRRSHFEKRAAVLAALAVFCGAAGCKKAFDVRHSQAYILGPTSNIHAVDKASAAQIDPEILNGSVLVATRLADKRVKFCSGTLVAAETAGANYRVLANHHCYAQTDADDKATPDLLPEACTGTSAYFGFVKGQTQDAQPIGCKEGTLRTNFDGDVSVFTLAKNPPEKYKPLALWDTDDPTEGRTALIIHYPDVEENMAQPVDGGAKLPTAAATINNCKVLGPFAVNEWDLDRTLAYSLRHTCDLIHGSSGSGLIDVKTGKLLGVNWGGIKVAIDDGIRTDNVATRARFAQAFLSNTVEDEVKAAAAKRGSSDAAASRSAGPARPGGLKGGAQAASETVKRRCGVVAGGGPGASLALLLALLTPLALLGPRALAADATVPGAPAAGATVPGASEPVSVPGVAAEPARKPEPAAASAPLHGALPTPAAGWAVSYLLNAAFLAEFDAVGAAAAEPDRTALRRRAAFALAAAKAKDQSFPQRDRLGPLLAAERAPGVPAVGATFSAALAPSWARLADFYGQPSPSCPLDVENVKSFAAHQKELLGGDRGLNPQALLAPVAGWDLAKMQCLVFALMSSTPAAKAKDGYDPVYLLTALQQTGSPLMQDEALRAMAALRFLQLGQFAETLRGLMDLSDAEPAYRLAYDVVQRVFSARQKGEGAVALQGL